MPYGRPMKGKSRRVPITIHASVETLDIIDSYVEGRIKTQEGQYSRSDFWNAAANLYLQHLGIQTAEQETKSERTENVPK